MTRATTNILFIASPGSLSEASLSITVETALKVKAFRVIKSVGIMLVRRITYNLTMLLSQY